MKLHFTAIAMLLILTSTISQAKETELYASKYYSFHSSMKLNAHLFLYNQALACKSGKVPNDSLALHAFMNTAATLSAKDLALLNGVLRFYKDSLLIKDLLFDSAMRHFSDFLAEGCISKTKMTRPWQTRSLDMIKTFKPYFVKLYWPAIDSNNKVWLNSIKNKITASEIEIVPELEKIYKTNLPDGKVRVDLVCYATWAGAYSYNDAFTHVVFSTASKNNQGALATEVIFHETSHFLADKLILKINAQVKNKHLEKEINLWHDVIFYTTGSVLEKYYKTKWQKFEPYFVQMKFEDKFPLFKKSVEACRLYWDPYLNGKVDFDLAVNNLVNYVLEKQ